MAMASILESGLLRQVAARVLPAAVFVLLLIWMTVGHVSDRVFQAEIDAKLEQQAENLAIVAKTRLENLLTTVRDLASNDLIVNGMVDPDAEANYLKAFLRSIAIEGSSDFPIVLTDYRGRPIAGRHPEAWDQADLTQWNGQVSQEKPLVTLLDTGLVVGVPVHIGRFVEGMFAVRILPAQLRQLLSPIGANGQIELVSTNAAASDTNGARSSGGNAADVQAALEIPGSDGLELLATINASATSNASSYFQWFMLVAFVLDLIALICGILAAVYWVIRPLNRFIAHLQQSQHDKDLDLFDAGNGPSEVRQLADAFNRFVVVEKQLLQEQSEQSERLKVALDREKELNGLQRQFVSMVCHEFRTPLAIVDGNAYRVLRRHQTMPSERMEEALTKIRLSVVRLTDLMESVLSMARLESGTIKFEPKPCDPAKMIQEVVANHQEINPDYRLMANLERLPAELFMDSKLMRQVVSNLLSNAIKYSGEGRQIWIDATSTDDGGLTLSVRDEGDGIPEAELERLFERFFRGSTSTGIAGTGIGLHIVKALIDLHDGDINVTSEVGTGTTFSFSLPCRANAPETPVLEEVAAA